MNGAMVPSSSVPPSTRNPGKAGLGLTAPRAIPGNQNTCEFTFSFNEALAGPMQTFEETVFLSENTFTKY